MVEPRIVPREEHSISRRDIDPDALKVLYRLRQCDHVAYLVGGSVRDLLLGRRPKDFDIGTSAHPYQVKKLFRNCWIIGRRFRLAHVKFGQKVIEVATFRRQVAPGEEVVAGRRPGARSDDARRRAADPSRQHVRHAGRRRVPPRLHDQRAVLRHRDLLDHRLRRRPRRSARGRRALDWRSRRAAARRSGAHDARDRARRAARLHDRADRCSTAIRTHRHEIAKSSPPRLLEEYYKILRAGSAEKAFRGLADVGLLEPISAELHAGAADPLWRSLAALDAYRRRFDSTPDTLTNAILLGSLLVPLGISLHPPRPPSCDRRRSGTQRGPRQHRPHPRQVAAAPSARSAARRAAARAARRRAAAADPRRCSGGCATSPRARARSARSRTAASSATR